MKRFGKALLSAIDSSGEYLQASLHGINYASLNALACKINPHSSYREDLIQEMCLSLLESPPGQTNSWYKQHCYFRGIDYIWHNNGKARWREEQYREQYLELNSLNSERSKMANQLEHIQETAQRVLDPADKVLFELYFVEGKTQKQIAAELNISRACVAKKIERMCHKIRSQFVVLGRKYKVWKSSTKYQ